MTLTSEAYAPAVEKPSNRPKQTMFEWLSRWDGPKLSYGMPPWRNPADSWALDEADIAGTPCSWCRWPVSYAAWHSADWREGSRVYVAMARCTNPACGAVEEV